MLHMFSKQQVAPGCKETMGDVSVFISSVSAVINYNICDQMICITDLN
jgi:hypothetical protein